MIDELMTKYSRYEHSQPNEAPVPLPEPDDIAADLTRLQVWLKEFSERKIPQSSNGIFGACWTGAVVARAKGGPLRRSVRVVAELARIVEIGPCLHTVEAPAGVHFRVKQVRETLVNWLLR
jgi:hypothetical protein